MCWTIAVWHVEQSRVSLESTDEMASRYLLKINTTADCVVQTVDLQLIVGTDSGRLVVFDLGLLETGRCIYQPI